MSAEQQPQQEFKSLIARKYNVEIDGEIQRKIACWNIANAARDESNNPLLDRISLIINQLKEAKPDLFVALEAGRMSRGISWTTMALMIQNETGLEYIGIYRVNASFGKMGDQESLMGFGKAVFVNPKTMMINNTYQHWMTSSNTIKQASKPYNKFGSDVVQINCNPVVDGKAIHDIEYKLGFVHFPIERPARFKAASWLSEYLDNANVWMGDFNTFPDDGGPEMLRHIILRNPEYSELVGYYDVTKTFSAFEHDIVCVPKSRKEIILKTSPESIIVKEDDENIHVRFASVLDRILCKTSSRKFSYESNVYPLTDASDHCYMETIISKQMI